MSINKGKNTTADINDKHFFMTKILDCDQHKHSKKIDLSLELQNRTKGISQFSKTFIALGLDYNFYKKANVFGNYRMSMYKSDYSDLETLVKHLNK